MKTEFKFAEVTQEQIKDFVNMSHVFNNTRGYIDSEKVILASFEDENLGDCVEKLDIAVYSHGEWILLDIEDKIREYNEIPLGYVLKDVKEDYTKVMVIIRRLSSMVLDTKREGVSAYIYNIIDDSLSSIEDEAYSIVYGILCRYNIALDMSDDMWGRIEKLSPRDNSLLMGWYHREILKDVECD